ncbi:hypothetical protein FDUTEX481_00284 [Tolypothrix sp. PCC 7601]|nr:hypothetical protein FDUTEX481_00284 [Tolypothrix sp. PCC 7601]
MEGLSWGLSFVICHLSFVIWCLLFSFPLSPVPITPYPQRGPRVPQSPFPSPLFPIPQSPIPSPQSPIPNPQSPLTTKPKLGILKPMAVRMRKWEKNARIG